MRRILDNRRYGPWITAIVKRTASTTLFSEVSPGKETSQDHRTAGHRDSGVKQLEDKEWAVVAQAF